MCTGWDARCGFQLPSSTGRATKHSIVVPCSQRGFRNLSVISALPDHSREERWTPVALLNIWVFAYLCRGGQNNLQESHLPLYGVWGFLFVLRQPWVAWNLLCKPGMRRNTCLCLLNAGNKGVCCHAPWVLGIELRLPGLAAGTLIH